MVAGNAFVISDGLDIEQKAVLRVPFVDINVTWTGAIRRAICVISGNTGLGTGCFHGYRHQLALRQATEEFGQLRLHLAHIIGV